MIITFTISDDESERVLKALGWDGKSKADEFVLDKVISGIQGTVAQYEFKQVEEKFKDQFKIPKITEATDG